MANIIKEALKKNQTLYALKIFFTKSRHKDIVNMILDYNSGRLLHFQDFGNSNSDKLIYLIALGENGNQKELTGFFALYCYTLEYLQYAERFHLMPCIYWGTGTLYAEDEPVNGTENVFEYYFKQVSELDYKKVLSSKYVKHCLPGEKSFMYEDMKNRYSYYMTEKDLLLLSEIHKKYIQLNEKTKRYMDSEINRLLNKRKTLGIHVRGTDYKKNYDNHPVNVTVEDYITEISRVMEECAYEQIFLATDDLAVLEAFQNKFKKQVLYFNDVYRGKSDVGIHCDSQVSRKYHRYNMGLEVLRDAYTLAVCDGIIAGLSRVSFAARIIKRANLEKYIHEIIIDKGINCNSHKFKA